MASVTWEQIAAWLGAAVLAMLTWLGKKLWDRVEKKADKDELKALIDEIRADREAARESRGRLYERVSTVAESLARMEGRLNGRAQ